MTCSLPRLLLAFLTLIVLTAPTAHARIGDNLSTIERRVTNGNQGLRIEDATLLAHYLSQTPLQSLVVTQDARGEMVVHGDLGLSVAVYYKTVGERAFESQLMQKNGRPVDNPPGWLLFVVFHRGQSVLEIYKRSGSITQAEINGLLSLHQGGSTWVREKLPKEKYPNDKYQPLLAHNHYREDAELLANADSSSLMIFAIGVDEHISKVKRERESAKAPDSLSGF